MALKNLNPSIRDLIPGLMGGPRGGYESELLRDAFFMSSSQATYVLPADWPTDADRWYAPEAISYPKRAFNSVEYLIDGYPTFAAMLEAFETATKPEHFIIIIGWALYLDVILAKDSGGRTSPKELTGLQILKQKTEQGVKVRVLLWNNSTPPEYTAAGIRNNVAQKWAIDGLNPAPPAPEETPRRALCILDDNTRVAGSHHQKIVIVNGSEGLIGFFGGVDINSDRILAEKIRFFLGPGVFEAGGPLHDVHARVTGQAAYDLAVLAINRWNFSQPTRVYMTPEEIKRGSRANMTIGHDPCLPRTAGEAQLPGWGYQIEDLGNLVNPVLATPVSVPRPCNIVRIGQTVGNPALAATNRGNAQSDAWVLIRHAIRTAKKFIYIEDQYLWSKDAAAELAAALPNIQHLTILIAPDDPVGASQRHEAVDLLYEKAGSEENKKKIGIYNRRETYHRYVHAKMFIIDDEVAIIGSANCNNRGYFHDSEVIGVIADPKWDEESGPRRGKWYVMELNLARKLRMQLWHEHLGIPEEKVFDGVAAAVHWRYLPPSANIDPYPYVPGSTERLNQIKSMTLDWSLIDPK